MIWVDSYENQDKCDFCALQQTLLDNIFTVKAIQLGSTNTPEKSVSWRRAQLSLLATPFMANILPPQILSRISAPPGEVQEAATEVINTVTSMPDKGW